MKKRILIYEDNKDLCEALAQLINMSDKYLCAGAFNNCRGVINDLKTLSPQVILMDIDMPGRNGIEAVSLVRQIDKELKIIMLTVFDDNQNVMAAISAGASGYLLKKYCFEKLFDAIDEVLSGGAPLSGTVARMVMNQLVNQSSAGTSENFDLTKREKEILNGLVKGLSYKMIAGSLNISFETVKTHIRNIYEKLQVHNQSEAVAKSIKNRIV